MHQETLHIAPDVAVPVKRFANLIVGSGAAGMNCAVQLFEQLEQRGVTRPEARIAILTAGAHLGASRMSGSDKQTYYKVGTHPEVADSALDFARTLTAGGCMHGDVALAEAAGSLRAFFHLVQCGVPFPHGPSGGYPGYKTDHDPFARATSAGPKTSWFMCRGLQRKTERYGIALFDQHEAARILPLERFGGTGHALLTLDKRRLDEPGFGLTLWLCDHLILAAGGPGMLFEQSVFPHGQCGIHGLAFEAGLRAQNMTEWQFGLASTKFRWNVSGTYMQAAPRIFSTNAEGGDEQEFLTPHFPSTARMATAIFLKGYQWPFDAQRVTDCQSSLIDLLVTRETREKGRRVFLDFRSNPHPVPDGKPFAVADMEEEARTYLQENQATQATPFERLRRMNPDAVDIYAEHGIDISSEPLEIAVCAQHHNGGFVVDHWWRSTVPGVFVIGEMAGTHGVKRPGGSALNAGQVGGQRAAEWIARRTSEDTPADSDVPAALRDVLESAYGRLQMMLERPSGMPAQELIRSIQRRCSMAVAHIRSVAKVDAALAEATAMQQDMRDKGIAAPEPKALPLAVRVAHLATTELALLRSVQDYLAKGGGSRGSYMVLDGAAQEEPAIPPACVPENQSLRDEIQETELTPDGSFKTTIIPVRPIPGYSESFEKMWAECREGRFFD